MSTAGGPHGTDKSKASTRGKAADSAVPPGGEPKKSRAKLKTIEHVQHELARIYRQAKPMARDVSDISKLANVLSILGRLIEGADFERRLAEVEARMQRSEDDE